MRGENQNLCGPLGVSCGCWNKNPYKAQNSLPHGSEFTSPEALGQGRAVILPASSSFLWLLDTLIPSQNLPIGTLVLD